MGIRSYVRDRKQVNASRAGQGTEKLSRGDFSHFGGSNGASVSFWDTHPGQKEGPQPANQGYLQPKSKREAGAPDFHPTNPEDAWGPSKPDEFTKLGGKSSRRGSIDPKTNAAYDKPETPEEESARGARMKVSDNVTVLGSKVGAAGERWKIDGETRGRVRSAKEQNAAQGRSDDLPTKADVEKTKKKSSSSDWDW